MDEKQQIEKITVDAFVSLHNEKIGTRYSVLKYGDYPDAVCTNANGEQFNVEVTVTGDRSGDIQWMLGRTDKRPYQGRSASCLQDNVLAQLIERLNKKALMRYGGKSALVIRDSSPVDWDWEYVRPQVREYLEQNGNPFELGIWVVNLTKTRLHRLDKCLDILNE